MGDKGRLRSVFESGKIDRGTAKELGLPPPRSRDAPPCPTADAADLPVLEAAARDVADEFRANFRTSLLHLYLPLFMTNVLAKVAYGKMGAAMIADVLDFVDLCVADETPD